MIKPCHLHCQNMWVVHLDVFFFLIKCQVPLCFNYWQRCLPHMGLIVMAAITAVKMLGGRIWLRWRETMALGTIGSVGGGI